jgi:hypothetical protein
LVRNCNWDAPGFGSGRLAREIHLHTLKLLLAVRGSLQGKRQEYIASLALVLLLWTPQHDAISAGSHCEEMLEAMLSRLSRHMGMDLTIDSVEQTNDLFATMGKARQGLVDCNAPGIAPGLPATMTARIRLLVSAIKRDEVPYIRAVAASRLPLHGTRTWPTNMIWPDALFKPISYGDLLGMFSHCLANLTKPRLPNKRTPQSTIDADVEMLRSFCATRTQALTAEQVDRRREIIRIFLECRPKAPAERKPPAHKRNRAVAKPKPHPKPKPAAGPAPKPRPKPKPKPKAGAAPNPVAIPPAPPGFNLRPAAAAASDAESTSSDDSSGTSTTSSSSMDLSSQRSSSASSGTSENEDSRPSQAPVVAVPAPIVVNTDESEAPFRMMVEDEGARELTE